VRYQLIVPPEISRAIRGFGLGREAFLKLLNRLRQDLEYNAANYKQDRAPKDPDRYFIYHLILVDHGRHRHFRFTVDDASASNRLFVEAAEEI